MKKLLTVLAIASIVLTSTFAVVAEPTESTNTNNIEINGNVNEVPFTFNLMYANEVADTENKSLNDTVYDLSSTETQTTNRFALKRSNGNLNKDLLISIDITARPFKGNVNGSNVTTAIIPEISVINKSGNNYSNIQDKNNENRNKKVFGTTIPYGYHSRTDVEIAAFILSIVGDETTDAGVYTSDIVVNYTYDQN